MRTKRKRQQEAKKRSKRGKDTKAITKTYLKRTEIKPGNVIDMYRKFYS